MTDALDDLIALLLKLPPEYSSALQAAIDQINTVLQGHFYDDDSRRAAFKYLSLHFAWYARYAEKVGIIISNVCVCACSHLCTRDILLPTIYILTSYAKLKQEKSTLESVYLILPKI